MSKNILVISGESSGDLYGAHLVSALKEILPDAKFSGVGGTHMKNAGVDILFPIDELAVIGVSEALSKLKILSTLFRMLLKKADTEKFDLAILVNYPGFNLRLAKALKDRRIPVIFYSGPQVWAWASWRIKAIKRYVDKMIVFFKFEKAFYKKHGIEVEYVGHPLVDTVRPEGTDLGIKKDLDSKIIALVPGSRKNEIVTLFGTLLETARIIHSRNKNVKFIITKHPEIPIELYQGYLSKFDIPYRLIDGFMYDCLKLSDFAIVASGSATLEAAILRVPMAIVYRVSYITGIIFLLLVRVANIGLVNIVAGKRIVPEYLQHNCNPRNIANGVSGILFGPKKYGKMKEDLESVNSLIGAPGASDRAARVIKDALK
ncbi:MAG: lipid-A-disaccharide synthase [Candidatus Omnitrophica bacterium]|nr:lipid-A-disaccharide synthase [Candidatus Omnitrophota bacterium]